MKKLLLVVPPLFFYLTAQAFAAKSSSYTGSEELNRLKYRSEALVKEGKMDEAILLLEKFFEKVKARFGTDDLNLIIPGEYLAKLYIKKGVYEKVDQMYGQNTKLLKATLGENHPKVADYMNNLAVYYLDRKEFVKSEAFFIGALKIYVKVYGGKSENAKAARANLAELNKRFGSIQAPPRVEKRKPLKKNSAPYHTASFVAYPYRENSNMLLYDEVGLLKGDDKRNAIDILRGIRDQGEAVCFIVILKSMASHGVVGWGADVYAWNLLEKWVGDGDAENRVLLFVSLADHAVSLIGSGSRPWVAKARLEEIKEDLILESFRSGRFAEGILKGVKKFSVSLLSGRSE